MEIEQMQVGFMAVFCYIVGCPRTKDALVIDPAGDEDRIVRRIDEKGYHLKYIVNTHFHPDHVGGNARMKELTGARIVMHKLDVPYSQRPEAQATARQMGFEPSPPVDIMVEDGDRITVGDVSLEVLHTPGHSPGGMCILGEGNVFTGDTLFVGAVGRTDMPGASMSEFMKAIKEKLLTLPDDTVVWPGHNYGPKPSSTIGFEKKTNPWLSGGYV
jgi:hydroxyacylglutathione hydrolase